MLFSFTNYLCATAHEAANELRQCDDPWKHNYNAIVADEFARKTFGNVATGDIIIWSSGPNGINENGGGDDIVCDGDWSEFGGPPPIIDRLLIAKDSQTNAVPQTSEGRDGRDKRNGRDDSDGGNQES